ncbi:hypothetical protein ACVCII_04270 [Burkholderia glumae]|uniref:hypothetical protein n=1 Tax=Burkholderia glumae TaxID=337 RepID=UPI002036813A|nr:hypothetical protein [Burkholderia glumae]MCM2546148.1 hypothetical protein [Burkholderia glumae]
MSDKLSDDERARERFRAAMSPLPCEWSERDGKFMDAGVQLAWFAWNKALAASPAPAISAEPVPPFGWVQPRGGNYFTRSEVAAKRIGGLMPVYASPPASIAPAISESEDALLTAARRAIPALAHAAERNPAYQRDYEELSKAIEVAARKGEKS